MKIHIIMHESFESPAAIETWIREREYTSSYTRLYSGDSLPENSDNFDFLIIMGGPQSPATTLEECPHFDARKEIELVNDAIRKDKYVFGVCLGAQIIGEALGAPFDHSPEKEIGFFEIELTDEGKKDPNLRDFPEKCVVGHWHGDMPGLTKDSKILAFSKGCPRQIVRYLPKVYGFQCHFEFTPDAIEGMISNSQEELENYKSHTYVWNEEKLRNGKTKEMNELLFSFFDKLTKE